MGSTGLPQRSITKKKTEDGRYRQISRYKEAETGRWENTHRNASQVYQVSKLHNPTTVLVCLILFFTPQSTIFQLCRYRSSWVEPVLSKDKCVLLKDTTQ